MKTTFITTVLNEEKTILPFLDSLFNQTIMPGEIVIVDGGSTDRTAQLIQHYLSENDIPWKLLVHPGNRAVGRNVAVKNASHEIILCSDAGCTLDKDWVKQISEPFIKRNIDVVSGYYRPIAKNVFEKSLATYTCVMPDTIDRRNFLPSSRSAGYTKNAWESVNGYPEHLDTCEDLVFARNMKKQKLRFYFAKNAIVYWPQRHNIFQAFKQFFLYARGDGNALYIRPQTPLLYARYLILFLLIIIFFSKTQLLFYLLISLGILYTLWTIGKNYKYVEDWHAVFILPILQITADIAVLLGTTIGILEHFMPHIFSFLILGEI